MFSHRIPKLEQLVVKRLTPANCRMFSQDTAPKYIKRTEKLGIYYHATDGTKFPGIVFCHGFKSNSNMNGGKALALENYCKKMQHPYVRFEYCGATLHDDCLDDITLGLWKVDLLTVLDKLTSGPQILVGSSMGGWLSLLAAMEWPERVCGIVGIATASDFLATKYEKYLTEEQKRELDETGRLSFADPDSGSITKNMVEESRRHHLLTRTSIPVRCPLRFIHGMEDESVPYKISLQLAELSEADDVDVILRKNGRHRMSEEEDIRLIVTTLDSLIKRLSCT